MNSKTLLFLLITSPLLLLLNSCIDSTLETTVDEINSLNETLSMEDADLLAMMKKDQEKVALCHPTDSETNSLVPIYVAVKALDMHLP